MIDNITVAIIGTIFTFVTALITSIISWRRARSDDMSQFRADLFKMNESLKHELGSLRERIRHLESEVHQKTITILDLETHIAKIRRVILNKLGHDIEDLMDDVKEAPNASAKH